jgi:hypothetical protein
MHEKTLSKMIEYIKRHKKIMDIMAIAPKI